MFKNQRKNPKKKIKKILFPFFLILTIGLSYLVLRSHIFNVKNVEIRMYSLACVNEEGIRKDLKVFNQSIFSLDSKILEQNLKSQHLCIKSASFTKKIPDSLEITIQARQAKIKLVPISLKEATISSSLENIATPSAKDFTNIFLADEEGKVFAKDSRTDLPTIFIYKRDVQLGENLGSLAINALKVLENLKKLNLEFITATLVDEFLVVDTIPKVIFTLSKDIDIQLASLQLILQQAKIDESRLEFIDLRFDKPIVRIAPKK